MSTRNRSAASWVREAADAQSTMSLLDEAAQMIEHAPSGNAAYYRMQKIVKALYAENQRQLVIYDRAVSHLALKATP